MMAPLKRIRLELARSSEYPNGSSAHGYDIILPLDQRGHIDVDTWKSLRTACRVHRFWKGESHKLGLVAHKPGGNEHATWVFDYDEEQSDDDEAGFRFGSHAFVPGEYLTLRSNDAEHTFRVASVDSF